jgi:hypothetical protein
MHMGVLRTRALAATYVEEIRYGTIFYEQYAIG